MILITSIENGFTIKIDDKLAQARPPVYEITKSGGDLAVSMAIKNVHTGDILIDGFKIDQIKIDGESFENFEDLSTAAVGVLFKKGGGSGGGGTSVHNELTGKQGGTTGQYFHLTESQYNCVIANCSDEGIGLWDNTPQTLGFNYTFNQIF